MEQAARPNRRRPSVGVVLIVLGLVVIAVLGARELLNTKGSSSPASSAAATVTATFVPTPPPRRAPARLAVFAAPRDPSDVVPAPLARIAGRQVVGGTPARPDRGRLEQSRQVAAVRGAAYYVWPISKQGLCTGLGDGSASQCVDVSPGPGEVGPTLVFSNGGRRYVGAVVGSGIAALTVSAPGYTCAVHVERSGFICVGPDVHAKPVIATLHLRQGGTTSVPIG